MSSNGLQAWQVPGLSPVHWCELQEFDCRPTDRAGIVAQQVDLPLVWSASAAEQYEIGSHILHDISSTDAGPLPNFLKPHGYKTRARYFARLNDVAVFPASGMVMPRPGEILTDSAQPIRWVSPRLQHVRGIVAMGEDIGFDPGAVAGVRYIEAPVMLFCHFAHQVYGHWLMDCLPAILRLRCELLASGRRLLAPRLLPWQRASLERIGLGSLVEEIDDELVLVRDLLFPSHIDTSAAGAPSATIAETFAALAAGCPATHAQEPRLVYVSRQNQGPKRKMINEDALVAAL